MGRAAVAALGFVLFVVGRAHYVHLFFTIALFCSDIEDPLVILDRCHAGIDVPLDRDAVAALVFPLAHPLHCDRVKGCLVPLGLWVTVGAFSSVICIGVIESEARTGLFCEGFSAVVILFKLKYYGVWIL